VSCNCIGKESVIPRIRLFVLLVRMSLAVEFGDGNCGDTETDNDDIWDNSDQIDKSAKVRCT
jgi:hypothetical protein